MSSDIDVKLLGPLDVRVGERAVQFDGAKQRTLFTALALRAPDAVTVDELVEALWVDEPPAGVVQALHKQVSRLRQRLGAAAPVERGAVGYALGVERDAIDAHRFEHLLQRARAALAQNEPEAAASDLRAALALWRGPALIDHRFEPFAQLEIGRLEELRMEAIEERMAAELERGRDADLVGELRSLVAEHPLRERLRANLMLALYRSGRQAEALEVMREGRRMLVDELGIEPGPELRRLESRILAQDPELAAHRPAPTRRPAPPDRFVTVATKVLVPARRSGLVERPQLVSALEARRSRRLTLVSAPTGFGKSSALTAWAAASTARFAWVSLDAGDADPVRFWSYVTAAVGRAAPELPDTAARRLRGPGVSIADEVLPVLVNELAMVARPLVLVLDDYHAIGAGQEIHAGVDYLIDRLGTDVHLVLATQTAPPLRLGRLRARGELNEYRAAHLRFTEAEAAALLNGTHDLQLAADELAGLHRCTEGWVAGLNLAALSLRETGDRTAFLANMPVDERYLVEYLWDEVVVRQPAETREFLMRTSVLERLSSSLCDSVLERADSGERLRSLEASNAFVIPLDGERRWYRYHTLFRAMLLRQLERYAPAEVSDLHRRASAWCAEHGDLQGVIEHAISAGDTAVAGDTLRRNWLALYSAGHANEVIAWVDRLPGDTLADYPELGLARAGIARAMGRLGDVEPWLERVERAALGVRDERARRELEAGVARQRAMARLSDADVAEAVRLGRAAVELRPADSPEAPSDRFFLGVCLFWTGSSREAERLLRAYLDSVPPGEQDVRRVFAMALLAVAHAGRGDLGAAEKLVAGSLVTGGARGLSEHPPTEMAYVASGMVALARDDLEDAEASLEHASTLARRGGDRIEVAHALLWLGRCRARTGDAAGAADALSAALEQLDGARAPALSAAVAAELRAVTRGEPGAPPRLVRGEALSSAELRVLRLLPSDLSYDDIAERLSSSPSTIRAHGRRIRRKLGASTRDEAVSAARRLELI
jgi:LuxR family transcriptional regulator, maltose regulon positive regulatory protein